jgi:hypothetical protein
MAEGDRGVTDTERTRNEHGTNTERAPSLFYLTDIPAEKTIRVVLGTYGVSEVSA